jgi:hypothetical protein
MNVHTGKHPREMTADEFMRYQYKPCKFCKSEALEYGQEGKDPRTRERPPEDDIDTPEHKREARS